jgi:hypothetical protein
MEVIVLGEGSRDNKMGGGGVEEETLDNSNFTGLLRKIDI